MYKKLKEALPLITVVFGALIALMIVFNVLRTDDGDAIMNGLTAVFGGEVAAIGGFVSVDVNFSFLNLLAFFLPLIAAVVLFFLGKKTKKDMIMNVVFGVLLLGVFLFSMIIFTNIGSYTKGTATVGFISGDYTYEGAKIAIGAVFGMIFAIVGVLGSLLHVFIQFKK